MTKYVDVFIRNSVGQFLLLKRSDTDEFMPGRWGLPGGKTEQNDPIQVSARREVFEETNLLIRSVQDAYHYTYPDGGDTMIFISEESKYNNFSSESIVLCKREHSTYIWLEYEDMIKILKSKTSGNEALVDIINHHPYFKTIC